MARAFFFTEKQALSLVVAGDFLFCPRYADAVGGRWLAGLYHTMTDSAWALGVVTSGWGIPLIVFSLFGGTIADRVRKRNLLMISQIAACLVTLVITILITTDRIALWHLFVSSMLFGVIFAFVMPARQAFIMELVGKEDMPNAIALGAIAMNICRIASPAIAGILLKLIGIPGVYWLIVITYGIVVATTFMIPPGGTMIARPDVPMMEDLMQGVKYVRGNIIILTLLMMAFIPILVAMPYQMLMPVFARSVFQAGETGLGLLMSAVGGGALFGSALIASLGNFKRKGVLMLLAGIIFGIALILFGLSKALLPAFFCLLFVGAGSSMFMTLANTLLMDNTPEELIGRVMSIYIMTFGLMPLGMLPAGALAEAFGAPFTVGVGGFILTLFLIVISISQPGVRRLR
ncbi:MAG: MFS transporter [Deltaproteobacteria bacterium]|nr:MFS transporter [Deltaproteobacteria bacterium]